MSYQIILFDLDDTLIDFGASETISLQRVYPQVLPRLRLLRI
jgi:FMN phosphatase YigB (HAD superfamily)